LFLEIIVPDSPFTRQNALKFPLNKDRFYEEWMYGMRGNKEDKKIKNVEFFFHM
jgi:hypothetical protein